LALFSVGPAVDPIDEETGQIVQQEIADVISENLDSSEAFKRFLSDCRGDLVHRLAKRRPRNRRELSRDQVRQILLDVGWDTCRLAAQCIEVQMREFCASLEQPLRSSSLRSFKLLYYRQASLGGLPLIMLRPRLRFFGSAFTEVLETGGTPSSMAVLYRLIDYYSQMMEKRRADDREYQRRRS
jgi:hypothetical protein